MKNRFFETICIKDGLIKHLEYHQKRYESLLLEHGQTLFKDLSSILQKEKFAQEGCIRCRLEYTLQNDFHAEFFPYKKRHISVLKVLQHDSINYQYKSVDRTLLNTLYEKREEADDVLIVKNGYITDTTIANIALRQKGRWYTPNTPLLQGTTRQRLLDEQKIYERAIRLQELREYDAIALMNAMIGFDQLHKCKILL